MKQYIGVIDSGLGGLTVVENIRKKMPLEDIVFFADSGNLPYGEKTTEELLAIARSNIQKLNEYPLKALVVACNTMDSTCGQLIRQESKAPVYGVILPAAKKAVKVTENGKIGVIATRATVRSNAYRKAIRSFNKELSVYSVSAPLLVTCAEDGSYLDEEKMRPILEKYLKPLQKREIDTLILGCTHFPLFEKQIRKMLPGVHIVSSSMEVIRKLPKDLPANTKKGRDIYLASSDPKAFSKKAEVFAKRKLSFKEV